MAGERWGSRRSVAPPGRVWRLVTGLSAAVEARLHEQLGAPTDDARCWSFATVRRCTSYADLEACLEATAADVVLLAGDVHGFRPRLAAALARRLPLVLLLDRPEAFDAGAPLPATCLVRSSAASADEVRAALVEAVAGGERRAAPAPARGRRAAPSATRPARPTPVGQTLVVLGEDRADRYALALNLAAELGRPDHRPWWRRGGIARPAVPTVLVDGDLDWAGPGLAAALALNPALNLSLVARETAGGADVLRWAASIRAHVQPITAASPQAVVLAGLPKPDARRAIRDGFLVELAVQLRRQFAWTVVAAGGVRPGAAGGEDHRLLAEAAERVFVVSRPDAVSLGAAAASLEALGLPERRGVELLLVGYQPRLHPHAAEIAVALGVPVAGVIPEDRRLTAALADQQPLVDQAGRRGAAARAVAQLAARLAGASEPPEEDTP